eukprot:scaffold272897_cov93-Cyclotella_meneghiniana.AAC.1
MVMSQSTKNITHCVGITLINAAKYNAKTGVCDLYGLSSVRGQCVRVRAVPCTCLINSAV